MPKVEWIKITTDMFSDDKIQLIENMPKVGKDILLIWVKLLCLAGRCNQRGYIYLSENIPHNEESLAILFKEDQKIVSLALKTFLEFGMILKTEGGVIEIANWNKYQNIEGMERVKEQNRLRKQKERENKKLREFTQIAYDAEIDRDCHVTPCDSHDMSRDSHVTVTQQNKNKNKNKEKEEEKDMQLASNGSLPDDSAIVSFSENDEQHLEQKKGEKQKADLQVAIDFYHDSFVTKYGFKPKINYAHAGRLFKELLAEFSIEDVKGIIGVYLSMTDDWYAGHPIDKFHRDLNRIIYRFKNGGGGSKVAPMTTGSQYGRRNGLDDPKWFVTLEDPKINPNAAKVHMKDLPGGTVAWNNYGRRIVL